MLWHCYLDLGVDRATGKRLRKHVSGPDPREVAREAFAIKAISERYGAAAVFAPKPKLVGEWLDLWLVEEVARIRTPRPRRERREAVERWIMPQIGHVRMGRLNVGHVQKAVAAVPDLSGKQRCLAVLREALEEGCHRGFLRENLAERVRVEPTAPAWSSEVSAARLDPGVVRTGQLPSSRGQAGLR